MKKILIALDYNPSAQTVAETGHALAKDMRAQVVLLHVMADPAYYAAYEYSPIMGFNSNFIGPETLPPDVTEDVRSGAEDFLQKSKQHLQDDTIETMVLEGSVAETIVKAAVEMGAAIIVMGSHSRRGLDKILMGSVAEKVLHSSSIPLFIIPTKG
ncbi:MAG TPA: universal stress protein [Chitinophagaceae bacterium]|nr:universal stress protein [Chitinophagaceae bacterium]